MRYSTFVDKKTQYCEDIISKWNWTLNEPPIKILIGFWHLRKSLQNSSKKNHQLKILRQFLKIKSNEEELAQLDVKTHYKYSNI